MSLCSSSRARRHHLRASTRSSSLARAHLANATSRVNGSPCGESNGARAVRSAASAPAPNPRANGARVDNPAATVAIGPASPRIAPSARSFPTYASTGNDAKNAPSGVSRSSARSAPCWRRRHVARSIASLGGGSNHGKRRGSTSSPATDFTRRIVASRSIREISGVGAAANVASYVAREYIRKHTPGPTRPARPLR